MRVSVEYSQYCTHDYHSGERYGDWEKSYDSSVTGVRVLREDEESGYSSETFLLPDDATTAYVVYMVYSTGDSFGRSSGEIDIIHCTASSDKAHALAKMVTENPNEYSIKFTDDFDREVSIYNRGAGYFESIEYVEVLSFDLNGSPCRYHVN
jgi:hypothetical protein